MVPFRPFDKPGLLNYPVAFSVGDVSSALRHLVVVVLGDP